MPASSTRTRRALRRAEVRAEADFYGSMDGASKFVRGDATAGILILVINMVGGLAIGTLSHGMGFSDAARVYTLLTIGDGLVAQIPALLLSTGVAIIVTRMSRAQDLGGELTKQLFRQPRGLAIAGSVLGVMGLIPGMPNVAFLLFAAACGAGAWYLQRRAPPGRERSCGGCRPRAPSAADAEQRELSWDDVQPVDLIGLEVGFRLVPLVDKSQGGELLARIRGVRRKLSQELGFLVQSVHIRDNLELAPNAYRISLAGVAHRRWRGLSRSRARASIRAACSASRRASRRAIRPSAWRRSGSSPASANRRRHSATRWWMPAP